MNAAPVDLHLVRYFSSIVAISGGRVVERGRHEDLVRAGGAYAHSALAIDVMNRSTPA